MTKKKKVPKKVKEKSITKYQEFFKGRKHCERDISNLIAAWVRYFGFYSIQVFQKTCKANRQSRALCYVTDCVRILSGGAPYAIITIILVLDCIKSITTYHELSSRKPCWRDTN